VTSWRADAQKAKEEAREARKAVKKLGDASAATAGTVAHTALALCLLLLRRIFLECRIRLRVESAEQRLRRQIHHPLYPQPPLRHQRQLMKNW
jgi:hypothetical protein